MKLKMKLLSFVFLVLFNSALGEISEFDELSLDDSDPIFGQNFEIDELNLDSDDLSNITGFDVIVKICNDLASVNSSEIISNFGIECLEALCDKIQSMYPADCSEIDYDACGIQTIYINNSPSNPVEVECDVGGWTVIQARRNVSEREDFYRPWNDYVAGFGTPGEEYWIGLDNIYELTNSGNVELQVDLEDYEGNWAYASYTSFSVGDSSTCYTLSIDGYSGTAGNSLDQVHHDGMPFSTYDNDNDEWPHNCAEEFRGGFWYRNCHYANLNGFQYEGEHESFADGINWYHWKGYHYSLETSIMKIRPVS